MYLNSKETRSKTDQITWANSLFWPFRNKVWKSSEIKYFQHIWTPFPWKRSAVASDKRFYRTSTGPTSTPRFRNGYLPSDSESVRTDAADGGLGGRGFGVGGDILFLPTNSTYVPGKSPFSCRRQKNTLIYSFCWAPDCVSLAGYWVKPGPAGASCDEHQSSLSHNKTE